MDGRCSLREAIASANGTPQPAAPGECPAGAGADVVQVPAGAYALSDGASSQQLAISTDVTVAGAGAATTTIRRTLAHRLVHVTGGQVELSGLTVTGGRAPLAGGGGLLQEGGTVTVRDSVLTGNRSADGVDGANASGPVAQAGDGSPGAPGGGVLTLAGGIEVTLKRRIGSRALRPGRHVLTLSARRSASRGSRSPSRAAPAPGACAAPRRA